MKELINRKKAACLALGCFFIFQLFAQENYIFHRIGLANGSYESLQSMGLETASNEFFMVGLTADSLTSNWNLVSLKVTKDSVIPMKRLFSIDSNMILGAQGTAFEHNGNYVAGGLISYVGQIAAAIYKYNPQTGDTIFCKYLVKEAWTILNQGKLTNDGNYMFIGRTDEFDPAGDYYVVKTDTLGNILWERRYGTAYYDNGLGITPTPDGGYLLFGSSDGYGEGVGIYSNGLLIKIDDNGSEEWRTNWGGQFNDCNWSVDVAPNGDIVAGGCIAEEFAGAYDAYIRKMDQDGQLLWDTTFVYDSILQSTPTVFFKIQFDIDKIIAAGYGAVYFTDSNYHHTAPWLTIFDQDGTVLSNRGYTSFFNGPTSSAWFEDIRPTKDGGYIAGGQYHPAAGDTGNQDMFVLKLDSAGCEYPGCQPPLSIAEPEQMAAINFTAYPNPFNAGITFDVGESSAKEIIITDIRGVLVDRLKLTDNQSKVVWKNANLSSGVYIARAMTDNGFHTIKVVKQ